MNIDVKILYRIIADWSQQLQYINTKEGLSQDHEVGLTLNESMLFITLTEQWRKAYDHFKICRKVFDNSVSIYLWLKTLSQTRNGKELSPTAKQHPPTYNLYMSSLNIAPEIRNKARILVLATYIHCCFRGPPIK